MQIYGFLVCLSSRKVFFENTIKQENLQSFEKIGGFFIKRELIYKTLPFALQFFRSKYSPHNPYICQSYHSV